MGSEQGFSATARLEPEASPAGVPAMRIVGITAIALAVSMVTQNAMFVATDAPGYGDPIEEVFAWHRQNRTVVAIAVAQEALHVPLLLGFLAGLHGLVGSRGGSAWSRLAMATGATLSAVFALYSVLWIGVVLSVGEHAEPNRRSSLPGYCMRPRLRWRCRYSALPLSALPWQRIRVG